MKLTEKKIREIIQSELILKEQIDHQSIKDVVSVASKLLSALETFMKSAPENLVKTTHKNITSLSSVLEDMVKAPGKYLAPKKKEVQLKPKLKIG